MVEQQYERVKSTVPCSSTNSESCILPVKIDTAWQKFKFCKLETLAPSLVASTEWTEGQAGRVDSVVRISYANGANWYWRITELSERNTTLAYELILAEPATTVTSYVGELKLCPITDSDQTFL